MICRLLALVFLFDFSSPTQHATISVIRYFATATFLYELRKISQPGLTTCGIGLMDGVQTDGCNLHHGGKRISALRSALLWEEGNWLAGSGLSGGVHRMGSFSFWGLLALYGLGFFTLEL
jgi:hypothetical protein